MTCRRLRGLLASAVASGLFVLTTTACSIVVEQEEAPGARRSALERQADEWAGKALETGLVAGLSVGVQRDGRTLFSKGYGLADVENEVEADRDTVYRIGSITKQFTAAAVMRLVEQGRVALDDDINEHIEFPTDGRRVTVEQLLNHTSGIKSYTGLGESWQRTIPLPVTHAELLGLVSGLPFDFEPGDEFRYNNTGYYLLGVLIEEVAGQSYEEHLESELFTPLGLEATTYCGEKKLIAHRAEGYEYEGGRLLNDDPISMTHPFAAGALCSDVDDLLRWQNALAGGEVVSAGSYERMSTPGQLNDGEALEYGFGLGIGDLEGHRTIRHGGGINGFVTMLADYPDDETTVVVLTNTPGPTAGVLAGNISRAALGLEIAEEEDDDEQEDDEDEEEDQDEQEGDAQE